MKTNEILNIGNDLFSTSERKSIYKKEIFSECKTDKEKKFLRMKLRKKLDNFIAEFIASRNNANKLSELKTAWQKYAKEVYINVNQIVDANANTEKKQSISDFLAVMNAENNTKQSNKVTNKTTK